MKDILIFLIITCYVSAENVEDELDKNSWITSRWAAPITQTQKQNGSKPQRTESDPECNPAIPTRIRNIEFSPIVEVETVYDSVYRCESGSRIKQISYQKVYESSKVTCNGVVVKKDDDFYDVIFATNKKERLNITSYTQVNTYLNGNMDCIECGTISGGKCAGDTFWGVGIYQANILDGCRQLGNDGQTANYRELEIKGKCRSKCFLGVSSISYRQSVSERGLHEHNIFESETQMAKVVE